MAFRSIESQDSGIPKWQMALCVGGTVAVGFGLYYYLGYSEKSKNKTKKTSDSSKKQEKEVNDQSPLGKAQAAKNKGNKYFKGGSYEQAIKCYDEAIELCPQENETDLSTFYQNRAAAYEQLGNWENVMRDCTAALDLNKRYVKALQRRAKACEILKDLEQALEDLTTVCIIDSFQNQGNLINVDRVLKALGTQHAKEAMTSREPFMPSKQFIQSYFESFSEDPIYNSLSKEKEADVDESENPLQKKSMDFGFLKAKKYLQESKYDKIIDCCSKELKSLESPYRAHSLLLRGTMHFLRGEMDSAMADFTVVIEMENIDPKVKVNAFIKRGTLYMHSDSLDKCLKDFETACLDDAQNADLFHHAGQVHLLTGNVEAAIENFKKAVDQNSNFVIAIVQKCYTEYRYAVQRDDKDSIDLTISNFHNAATDFPKSVECLILYAQVLTDQSRFEEADQWYERAAEIDVENPAVYVHRALLVLQWKADLARARELINTALQYDDRCELAYENLATIEVQTGNLKRGVELFNKAIPLAKTEMEMAHLFSLRDAAVAQIKVVDKMGIALQNIGPF